VAGHRWGSVDADRGHLLVDCRTHGGAGGAADFEQSITSDELDVTEGLVLQAQQQGCESVALVSVRAAGDAGGRRAGWPW